MDINLKIIVCYHKPGRYVSNDIYIPVQVGKETSKYQLPIQWDNQGDNISALNYTYCELTGLYWAWKNIEADYIGLCHYRRFYTFKHPTIRNMVRGVYLRFRNIYSTFSGKIVSRIHVKELVLDNEETLRESVLNESVKIKKYLNKHLNVKLICLNPVNLGIQNNYSFFSSVSGKQHIEIIKSIVEHKYPAVYASLLKVLKCNRLNQANMIICAKDIHKRYCEFIFSVLEEHQKIIIKDKLYNDLTEMSISRLAGYLGEILTSTYVHFVKQEYGVGSIKNLRLLRSE